MLIKIDVKVARLAVTLYVNNLCNLAKCRVDQLLIALHSDSISLYPIKVKIFE